MKRKRSDAALAGKSSSAVSQEGRVGDRLGAQQLSVRSVSSTSESCCSAAVAVFASRGAPRQLGADSTVAEMFVLPSNATSVTRELSLNIRGGARWSATESGAREGDVAEHHYAVGLLTPKSLSLSVAPAGRMFRLRCSTAREELASNLPAAEAGDASSLAANIELLRQYGSRKMVTRLKRGAVARATASNTGDQISDVQWLTDASGSTALRLNEEGKCHPLAPTPNMDATSAADLWKVEEVVGQEFLHELAVDAQYGDSCVAQRFCQSRDEVEDIDTQALNFLWVVCKIFAGARRGLKVPSLAKSLGCSFPLISAMLHRFALPSAGAFACTKEFKEKQILAVCALILALFRGKAPLEPLAQDTGMSVKELKDRCRILGCSIQSGKSDSGGRESIATVKWPISFPSLVQRKRAKQ